MRPPRPSRRDPFLVLVGLSAAGVLSGGEVAAQGNLQAPAPLPAAMSVSAPVCPTACDNPQALMTAVDHAGSMNRAKKRRPAVEYLEGCQLQCPVYDCALVHALRGAENFYDPRQYKLKLWNYAKACTVQPLAVWEQKEDRPIVEAELRRLEADAEFQRYLQNLGKPARIRKIGLGLLLGGIALSITGVGLAIAGETDYVPAAGSCPSAVGLNGDPCVLDYHARTVYLPVLGVGLGVGIAGAVLMRKYKEKAPKSFLEAP